MNSDAPRSPWLAVGLLSAAALGYEGAEDSRPAGVVGRRGRRAGVVVHHVEGVPGVEDVGQPDRFADPQAAVRAVTEGVWPLGGVGILDRRQDRRQHVLDARLELVERQARGPGEAQDGDRVARAGLNNLANLHRDEGQLALAEPMYRRALSIREKVLGLFFRLIGKDPLNRHFDPAAETYWSEPRPRRSKESYFRQF